ncbi:MAG: oligosaccharide flippase family protein, partial [Gemmatimonadetes bacterium]|nr:oligosaccharide flippase family protein [Gemmatimonadota bacterium]
GALGYYTKASGWLPGPITRFMMPIAGVAISTLSRLVDQPDRFRAYFKQGILIIALIGIPAIAFISYDGNQLVLFLLGDQWFPTVPVFRRLAPAALAALAQMGFYWAFLSLGHTARQLRWEIFSTSITVAGIAFGVRWGIEGAALGYSIASVLLLPPGAWYCFRGTMLRVSDLTNAFLLPVTASLVAMGVLYAAHVNVSFPAVNVLRLMLDAALFSLVYMTALLSLPRGRRAVFGVARLLKDLRRARQ